MLSEFAGAAQALGAGCVRVNPYDTRELARGYHQALSMSVEQRSVLHAYADQVCGGITSVLVHLTAQRDSTHAHYVLTPPPSPPA